MTARRSGSRPGARAASGAMSTSNDSVTWTAWASATRALVLPHPGLDQFLEQSHRHRFIHREAVRALAGHVAAQLFVLLRLTHRIHADVVFERREIDQPSLVVEMGHPIAESLGGFRRHCLDQFAQLTKARLRRFRRSRYVRVNRLLAVLLAHCLV